MATITVLTTADLDVVNKQRELTTEALDPDGVYIRLKETLLDLMNGVNTGMLCDIPSGAEFY